VGPGIGGGCIGGGGGGIILERSLFAEKLLVSASGAAPSDWFIDFCGSPGGGGGSTLGTYKGDSIAILKLQLGKSSIKPSGSMTGPTKHINFFGLTTMNILILSIRIPNPTRRCFFYVGVVHL
jgi:hypothetical protein